MTDTVRVRLVCKACGYETDPVCRTVGRSFSVTECECGHTDWRSEAVK